MTQPNGRVGTVLFFWDYDTQWGADRSRSPHRPRDWGRLEFENTERLLELHAEYGISACFAVVGAAAMPGQRPYHDPDQIRRIHAAGHEVASHSFRHEWLPGIGYSGLFETLRLSKHALEQCIGAPVVTFVPPFNQPFDHAQGWSFSLSERREAGPERIDLRRLCMALRETGYRVCRVSYRSLYERALEVFLPRRPRRPARVDSIAQVTCLRVNTPCGFSAETAAIVAHCAEQGGIAVVHGHPHSLQAANAQNERWLVPFLREIRSLRERGLLRTRLPRHFTLTGGPPCA